MVSQKVVIKNPTGLHLRPAGVLCKEAMQFKSLITFTFRDNTANATVSYTHLTLPTIRLV